MEEKCQNIGCNDSQCTNGHLFKLEEGTERISGLVGAQCDSICSHIMSHLSSGPASLGQAG